MESFVQDVQYLEYIEERSRQRMEAEDVSERQRIAEAISKREASEKLKEDLRAKRDIEIRYGSTTTSIPVAVFSLLLVIPLNILKYLWQG